MLSHSSNTPSSRTSRSQSSRRNSTTSRPSNSRSQSSRRNSTTSRPSNSSTLSSRTNQDSRLLTSSASSRSTTVQNSSMPSRPLGSSIAHKTGIRITARGSNAAGTTATASRTTVTTDTLVRTTRSSSTTNLIWWLADSRASSTAAFGSAWSIRGPTIGQTTGTKPTTCTLYIRTMGTTCTTADILASASPSASRCNAYVASGRGGAQATVRRSLSRYLEKSKSRTATAFVPNLTIRPIERASKSVAPLGKPYLTYLNTYEK